MKVPTDIMKHAEHAASKYLNDGVEMNYTITKIAKDSCMNSDKIDRVCEVANHLVNKVAVKVQDRYTAFPVADPTKVKVAVDSLEGNLSPLSRRVSDTTKDSDKVEKKTASIKNTREDIPTYDQLSVKIAKVRMDLGDKTASVIDIISNIAKEVGIDNAEEYLTKVGSALPEMIKDHILIEALDKSASTITTKVANIVFIEDDSDAECIQGLADSLKLSHELSILRDHFYG